MKYFERLDPLERKKLVLRAVAVDLYMEGMDQSVQDCVEELRKLNRHETKTTTSARELQKA